MDERTQKVVEHVVGNVQAAMVETVKPLAASRCIMASKVGVKAFAYFGVRAVPVPVNVMVGNDSWIAWMQDGQKGPMPDDAWSVGAAERMGNGPNYSGHVLLRVDDWLIDLDFQQFGRPEKGIIVPPTCAFPMDESFRAHYDAGNPIVYFRPGCNVIIHHTPHREHGEWRQAPDWKRSHNKTVGSLIRKVKQALAS